jgi:hypothetical protein
LVAAADALGGEFTVGSLIVGIKLATGGRPPGSSGLHLSNSRRAMTDLVPAMT